MEKDPIQSLLAQIMGQLDAQTSKDEKVLNEGLLELAKAIPSQERSSIFPEKLSVQSSDLFYRSALTSKEEKKLDKLIKEAKAETTVADSRIFVRETPVRSSQIPGSVPNWAQGAKVEKTIGPITRIDGRQVFVDVYRVEKLIALRKNGTNEPLLYFKAEFSESKLKKLNSPPVEVTDTYKIVPGSIWIKANLLAAGAPNDRFVGLQVKSGHIKLSANPNLSGENLVLTALCTVQVNLQLESSSPFVNGNKKHGKDAAQAELKTPETFSFTFGGPLVPKITGLGPSSLKAYKEVWSFSFQANKAPSYSTQLNRVLIPLISSNSKFSPQKQVSPLLEMEGEASLSQSWWGIPAAVLDLNAPLQAAGAGGIILDVKEGIQAKWKGLDGNSIKLGSIQVLADPGRIGITALAGSAQDSFQKFSHWKDKLNPHGTELLIRIPENPYLIFNSLAEGVELILTKCHAQAKVDRPKLVNGHAVEVKTKDSLLILAGSDQANLLYLIDDNILWDNKTPFQKVPTFKNLALALENALFTVSPVNGLLIFGTCDSTWTKITDSVTFLNFGLVSYLPTLPDPYLANFGILGRLSGKGGALNQIVSWLFCRIVQKSVPEKEDEVIVSFHFGNQQSAQQTSPSGTISPQHVDVKSLHMADSAVPDSVLGVLKNSNSVKQKKDIPNYEEGYKQKTAILETDYFALLDVSSNANQVGVSYGMNPQTISRRRETVGVARSTGENEATIDGTSSEMITVEGMQVKVPGHFARIFLLPQVAWEPTINTFEPVQPMDPPAGFNYYPNDGGPTRLLNTSTQNVTLAPIPLTDFLIQNFKDKKADILAQFTLPFGLKALARLDHSPDYNGKNPKVEMNRPSFKDRLFGGIQIRAIGGDAGAIWPQEPHLNDSPMFEGNTTQLNNILDLFGNPTGASTLGDSVTVIFNGEFGINAAQSKGVPVSTIDFTGYGASTFSNWLSPSAAIAQTSQARFDVMLGRTSHEIIQVKSLVYPWGIRVVRTITLFRTSSGFIYRLDSGWQPETDGLFDFRYKFKINGQTQEVEPYRIHPGTIRGLFNIKNIREDAGMADFERADLRKTGDTYIDPDGNQQTWNKPNENIPVFCRPVWFDADVELENLVQGHSQNRTPAKKILGYVQLAPSGVPLSPSRFRELLDMQGGLIGGDIDCIMDLNKSGQQMRITRFDFSHAKDPSKADPVFVASARGSVILPKTGSWSIVQHNVGTGEVTPLPQHVPVPIIRVGEWTKNFVKTPLDLPKVLLRMASPSELLRNPVPETLNFGILQTTSTQKALILAPSFEKGRAKLMSKIPPLYADAYSLMAGNGIFPNSGNAINEFGKAFPILTGTGSGLNAVKVFVERADIQDGTSNVFELLAIEAKKQGESIVDQGFKLLAGKANEGLNKALAFDIPPFETDLVNMEGLRIYIQYATTEKRTGQPDKYVDSKLNFDIDSFAADAAKTWKSRLNNLAMVVDLGDFEGLMKIKGNFDSKKGSESGYKGEKDSDFPSLGYPTPDVEFHKDLQPVIDLLQVLASLSEGDYGAVMKKGLEIAMSNAGEIWEYKFEAKKEIPLVRFPPEENLYNSPTTPLKLEAGLELGVYFNAALKVTSDPKQLLPTAGAYIGFRGGLQVLCASVGVGSIFAVGEVALQIACDTKIGPSLTMKFGFGVSIAVGLPVVGTVSVTYIVGCELYATMSLFKVTAYMLFRGHASLVGGLVSVTIYIEASGAITRQNGVTDCTASVTFGLDISICFIIDISFEETWQESRQIA